ncbi:hypothetical protein VTH06DRAFT_5463 [Thermothelomyces fergusii]
MNASGKGLIRTAQRDRYINILTNLGPGDGRRRRKNKRTVEDKTEKARKTKGNQRWARRAWYLKQSKKEKLRTRKVKSSPFHHNTPQSARTHQLSEPQPARFLFCCRVLLEQASSSIDPYPSHTSHPSNPPIYYPFLFLLTKGPRP